MNRFHYLGIFRSIFILSILILFVGCGGSGGDGKGDGSYPTITNFEPTSGLVGETVTITGTNFSTNLDATTVSFNGTLAVVSSCTHTQIVTTVPEGATTGPIIVSVVGISATSATSFTVM